jgi:uncharacterized DUF497 family protein
MRKLTFDWDQNKALSNQKKHKVSFQEAKSVFYDQNARLIHDPEHSLSEDRYILLGISSSSRLLIVCHCYQKNEQVIRLTSARLANSREHQEYREFLL